MISSALLTQILTYLVPLVLGYLLRHWGVNLPGLPSAPSTPAAPSDHSVLLQQVKAEAESMLKQAINDALQKGLADLKAASQQK